MNAGARVVALLLASTAGCTSARPASPSSISPKPTRATTVQAASKDVYATLSSSPTPWFLIRRGDEVWFHGEQGELAAFDLATAKWERLRDLPDELADPNAAVLADGRLLVIGQRSRPFPAVICDGRQPWTAAPPLPAKADGPLLASLPDGRVIAVGGFASGREGFASDASWLYDARADRWAPGAKLPSSIMTGDTFAAAETAVVLGSAPNALPRAFTFDRATSTWTVTDAASDLDGFAAMQLRDGRIALVGGRVPIPACRSPLRHSSTIPRAGRSPCYRGSPRSGGLRLASSWRTAFSA